MRKEQRTSCLELRVLELVDSKSIMSNGKSSPQAPDAEPDARMHTMLRAHWPLLSTCCQGCEVQRAWPALLSVLHTICNAVAVV